MLRARDRTPVGAPFIVPASVHVPSIILASPALLQLTRRLSEGKQDQSSPEAKASAASQRSVVALGRYSAVDRTGTLRFKSAARALRNRPIAS